MDNRRAGAGSPGTEGGADGLEAVWAAVVRSQAVAEFDPAGHLLAANDVFLRLFGYTLGEAA